MPLTLCTLGSCVYAQAVLHHDTFIYTSCIAGMTGVHHHAQLLLIEMGSLEILAWAGLELQPSQSLPL
jgi:hypothetical protein